MSDYLDKKENIIGKRFGHLTVTGLKYGESKSHPKEKPWLCKCDCGNGVFVGLPDLKNGRVISCGCVMPPPKPRKGYSGEFVNSHPKLKRLYNIWGSMKQRCFYEKNNDYHRYGVRGITVCDEWANDFKTFALWALLNGYDDNLSIDRIDNDGDYTPENCRWATRREQDHNRPGVRLYYYKGEEYTLSELAGEVKVDPKTIERRLKSGMELEDAVSDAIKHTKVPWSLSEERRKRNERDRRSQERKKAMKSANMQGNTPTTVR